MTSKRGKGTDGARKSSPFTAPQTGGQQPFMAGAIADLQTRAELAIANKRVADLEAQVKAEQEGRRQDIERIQDKLLRELSDAKATIARLETELRLKGEQGGG